VPAAFVVGVKAATNGQPVHGVAHVAGGRAGRGWNPKAAATAARSGIAGSELRGAATTQARFVLNIDNK